MRTLTDPRTDRMMITHWALPIGGIDPEHVKLTYLHAVVSRILDTDRSHGDNRKPWALTPMIQIDGIPAIHFVTLSEQTFDAAFTGSFAGQPIRLGSQEGAILANPMVIEQTSVAELSPTESARAHAIRFVTPTVLRHGARTSPLLDPVGLAKSMASRWTQLFGRHDLDDLGSAGARGTFVSDIDGRNAVLKMHSMTVSGFVGTMRFEYETDAAAALFGRLWAFAEHAGAGAYTTSGLGCIEIEKAEPARPRTPRRPSRPAPRPRTLTAG